MTTNRSHHRRLIYLVGLVFFTIGCHFLFPTPTASPTISITSTQTPFPTPSAQTSPASHADVMIFSAHPDDETICCAAAIQKARAEGKSIHIVIFTNGDGWPESASRITGKPVEDLLPADFLELARVRQLEALSAAETLGLTPADVTFLGYPDGGLDKIYNSTSGVPFVQQYTLKDSTYGPAVQDYHSQAYGSPAQYLRVPVLKDVADLVRKWNPDEVYMHNGSDDHLDHKAVFWFVRDVLQAIGSPTHLLTYFNTFIDFIHIDCHEGFSCPAPVTILPTEEQARTKFDALMKYQSQIWLIWDSEVTMKVYAGQSEQFWPVDL